MHSAIDEPTAAVDARLPLADQLAFERLLSDLSALFADLPAARVVDEIARALRSLLDFLGFDRGSFTEFVDGDREVRVLCAAARPGHAPVASGSAPVLPWYLRELSQGRVVVMPRIPEDLPPEAAAEAEYCRRIGLRSNLGIPLRIGGRVVAAVTFAAFHRVRPIPADLVARIKILGEVFAQALVRGRRDQELAAALTEIARLKGRLEAENAYLRQSGCGRIEPVMTSQAPRFQALLGDLALVAPTSSTVLLLGETGTGKEILAGAIHGLSDRRQRAMIKVNCAALPASLIEAELFGREKGAYTGAQARQMGRFELADGSTLFLDEVGELPLELQTKLLRVLQDGTFERVGGIRTIQTRFRLIAATNRDLAQAVARGAFREDLYYRLNVFPLRVPPLRERREDIPALVWAFVREFGQAMGKTVERLDETSLATLLDYHWPGNVRELRNLVERAMILNRGSTALSIVLDPVTAPAPTPATATTVPEPSVSHTSRPSDAAGAPGGTLAAHERAHILTVLERTGWRIRGPGGAAESLGLKPTTLESRMKRLGVRRPSSGGA